MSSKKSKKEKSKIKEAQYKLNEQNEEIAKIFSKKSDDEIMNGIIRLTDKICINTYFMYFMMYHKKSELFNINGDDNDYKKSYIYKAIQHKNYLLVLLLVYFGAKITYNFTYFKDSLLYDCMKNNTKSEIQLNAITSLLLNFVQFEYKTDHYNKLTPYTLSLQERYDNKLCKYSYNREHKTINTNYLILRYIQDVINDSVLHSYSFILRDEFNKIKIKVLTKIRGLNQKNAQFLIDNIKYIYADKSNDDIINKQKAVYKIFNELNKYHFTMN